MNSSKYPAVERAVKWLTIMLMAEFVLGVLLTTVINYTPEKHNVIQTVVLGAHIAIGVGLLIGSFAHIFTSRSSRLLGIKPILGFGLIVGAFSSGTVAAKNGNSLAVLVMALCFAGAIITYGRSYLVIKTTQDKK